MTEWTPNARLHDCVKPWVQECVSAWMDDSWVAEWLRDWEKTGGSLSAGGLQERRGKRVRNEPKMKSWLWLHVWMVDYKFPKPNLRQATSTLSYLFNNPPTASLGHLFSQLLLLWGADYLANVFSDPLLPWATALSYFLSRTPLTCVYEPPVQLQSRKALGSQHAQKLSVWQPGSGYSAFSNF